MLFRSQHPGDDNMMTVSILRVVIFSKPYCWFVRFEMTNFGRRMIRFKVFFFLFFFYWEPLTPLVNWYIVNNILQNYNETIMLCNKRASPPCKQYHWGMWIFNLKVKTKQKVQASVLISVSVVEGDPLKMEVPSQHATQRDIASHSLYWHHSPGTGHVTMATTRPGCWWEPQQIQWLILCVFSHVCVRANKSKAINESVSGVGLNWYGGLWWMQWL